MVYVTGDTHADFSRFSEERFEVQKEMTRDDIVIICGDFGGVWADTEEERAKLDWLSEKNFTLCFVDGNHESFDRLYSDEFETVDFHGGKAHRIRDNIYHLMRGYVFEFDEKKFFAFGGASSHDIQDGILDKDDFVTEADFMKVYDLWRFLGRRFRINHVSWWKEELPSMEEMERGLKSLAENNWKIDYVISHSLPQEVCSALGYHVSDRVTKYFNQLLRNGLRFKEWYAGHLHVDERIWGRYFILYENIVRII